MEFMSALGSQEDAYRPSLFELDAQQKLRELLQPAVQYVLAVSLSFIYCKGRSTIHIKTYHKNSSIKEN